MQKIWGYIFILMFIAPSLSFAQLFRPSMWIGGVLSGLLISPTMQNNGKPDLTPPKVEKDTRPQAREIYAFKLADCKSVRPRFHFRSTHYTCVDGNGNSFNISVAEYNRMVQELRGNSKIIFYRELPSAEYPNGRVLSVEPQKQSGIQPNLDLDQSRVGPFEGFFYFDPARRGNEKAFYMVISRMMAAIQNDTDKSFLSFDRSEHKIPDENNRPMVDEVTSKIFMRVSGKLQPIIIHSAGVRELGAGAASASLGASQIIGLPFVFDGSFSFGIMISIPLSREEWKKIGRGDLSPFFDFTTEFVRGAIFIKPNGKNQPDDILLQLDINRDGHPDDFVIVYKHHGTGKVYNAVNYYVYGVGGDWQEVSQAEFKIAVDQFISK